MKSGSYPFLNIPAAVAGVVVLALIVWLVLRSNKGVTLVAGHSVDGIPISYTVYGDGPRVVMYIASIHGSEGAGTPLLKELARHMEENPDMLRGLTVILLPVANPDGLSRGDRLNTHGVDLNRNFPAGNRQDKERYGLTALSEPESRALHALIETREPAVIVSIHQPLECVDWDGPPETEALAKRFSDACGLPVKKLGARPGSLGAWFSEVPGKPILTLELPRDAPAEGAVLWEKYGRGLLTVLEN